MRHINMTRELTNKFIYRNMPAVKHRLNSTYTKGFANIKRKINKTDAIQKTTYLLILLYCFEYMNIL